MTDTPQILLTHHLKKLRLPTFLSELTNLPANAPQRAKITSSICRADANWN